MVERTHTTTSDDNGTFHYWEVRGPNGAVSLSLLHSRLTGFVTLAEQGGFVAQNLAATDSGHWVFDVVQEHRPNPAESGWSCPVHGDSCDVDAFVDRIAGPIWQRLRANGVTDTAVYAELEALYALEFEQAAA